MSDDLSRVALVTGANGGIGAACARWFLEEGLVVFLGVRRGREVAEALVAEFPERAQVVDLDVCEAGAWEKAVAEVVEKAGRLDILVNNAGSHEDQLLASMSSEAWEGVLRGNLDSVFLGCQAVVRTMMGQRYGRIVNVSSLSALFSPLGQSNYAAAKAGVIGLTQSFSKEVGRAGITVNAVCPGYVETGALDEMDEAQRKARMAAIPMRRFGKPEEVAAAVGFLASEGASYVTGSTLKIDGGIL